MSKKDNFHLSRAAGEVGSRSEPGEGAARRGTLTRHASRGDLSRAAGEAESGPPRTGWQRKAAWVDLHPAEIAALLRPIVGGATILSVQPVTGGLVNTNLKVTLDKPPHLVLLRLFQREPLKARIEAALDALLGDSVPRARFIHFDETNPVTGHPYAVLQWIEGMQLGVVASEADEAALDELGHRTGAVLAQIHSLRFDRHGFFATDLGVPVGIDLDRAGLLAFMRQCLCDGPGGERLGAELTARLFAFVEREGDRLNAWLGAPCLTHADFNPSNILVRREESAWRIAAVLDWEFALSATPALDFGNLLRPPFGEAAGFVDGLAHGYRAAGGFLPNDWFRVARIADLFAWADLLGRRSEDPALTIDARRIIAATIESD